MSPSSTANYSEPGGNSWVVGGTLDIASGGAITKDGAAKVDSFTVALAAGAANTMTITITAVDATGATVAKVVPFEFWISEAATGIGLTADSFSGNLTATSGAIHTAITAKKHVLGVTAATGVAVLSLVDTAKPADQYCVLAKPDGDGVVVSVASGTRWG